MTLHPSDPEKAKSARARDRKWRQDSAERYAKKRAEDLRKALAKGEKIGLPEENRDRQKKLEARNYGPKAKWIRTLTCYVTGWEPTEEMRCVAAHVTSRGAGGSSEDLVPFHPLVEADWHGMHDAAFEQKYGRNKQDVKDAADLYESAWKAMQPSEAKR